MTLERKIEILKWVDRYNRGDGNGIPLSPFIARSEGQLGQVSKEIGVPVEELGTFLDIINLELPSDYA